MKSPVFSQKCSVLLRSLIGKDAKVSASHGIVTALTAFTTHLLGEFPKTLAKASNRPPNLEPGFRQASKFKGLAEALRLETLREVYGAEETAEALRDAYGAMEANVCGAVETAEALRDAQGAMGAIHPVLPHRRCRQLPLSSAGCLDSHGCPAQIVSTTRSISRSRGVPPRLFVGSGRDAPAPWAWPLSLDRTRGVGVEPSPRLEALREVYGATETAEALRDAYGAMEAIDNLLLQSMPQKLQKSVKRFIRTGHFQQGSNLTLALVATPRRAAIKSFISDRSRECLR